RDLVDLWIPGTGACVGLCARSGAFFVRFGGVGTLFVLLLLPVFLVLLLFPQLFDALAIFLASPTLLFSFAFPAERVVVIARHLKVPSLVWFGKGCACEFRSTGEPEPLREIGGGD